jgi:hypothetical protein
MATGGSRARRFLPGAAVGAAVIGASATAATTIRDFATDWEFALGAVAVGADLDKDGVADVLVSQNQKVRAYSGKDGTTIRDFVGVDVPSYFGRAVAFSPDVDGDDVPDVLVGATGTGNMFDPYGAVVLFSGATGAELHRGVAMQANSRFGAVVASIGDVTGDGVPDFAAGGGGVFANVPGEFRAFSGANGEPVAVLQLVGTATDGLGHSIAALGDVTGDGVPDVAIGAPGAAKPSAAPGRGRVYVLSGSDGRVVKSINGKTVAFGYSTANAGDLDGDGRADLAVGGNAFLDVVVYSTRTWKTIRRFPRPPSANYYFGDRIADAVDVNRDGFPDLAVNSVTGPTGTVHVFSGAPGLPFQMFELVGDAGDFIGPSLALAPDFDGDGIGDLLTNGFRATSSARLVGVVPTLPPKFSFAVALTRSQAQLPSNARGVFQVKLGGGKETVTVTTSGLPAGGGTYTIHLEDGPSAGTFAQVGSFTATPKGGGSFKLVGEGVPPAQLGITDVRQLAGRRVEIRDAGGAAVLAALLPYPGAIPADKGKAPLIAAPASPFPTATGSISTRYVPAIGASNLTVTVKGIAKTTALTLEVETAVGAGAFVDAGAFANLRFVADTGKGQPLPGGAASLADLTGRAVRVKAGADVAFVGLLP